jgi:transcription elongation factor Elf1
MPRDDLGYTGEEEEEEARKSGAAKGSKRRFDEFECPACTAHNPVGDGFGNNDELICNYCGVSFRAAVDDEGKLKMKES